MKCVGGVEVQSPMGFHLPAGLGYHLMPGGDLDNSTKK